MPISNTIIIFAAVKHGIISVIEVTFPFYRCIIMCYVIKQGEGITRFQVKRVFSEEVGNMKGQVC